MVNLDKTTLTILDN